jgi:hypothetical protein
MPQLLLNIDVTSTRLPPLASIRLLLRQFQGNVLTLLAIILIWFLTHGAGSSSMLELLEAIGNSAVEGNEFCLIK